MNASVEQALEIQGVRIRDTFAEAFDMWAASAIVTARSPAWAAEAARCLTGFATSVIGCKVEAGVEAELALGSTPDGRPGVSVLLFAFDRDGVGKRLVERIGQTVLTCPTTACFDGLPAAAARISVGGQLRFFGDGFQASKMLDGRRYWRVPVMEGEFLVEDSFGAQPAVGGGNFLIAARSANAALAGAEAAVAAMRRLPGVVLPFPGGVVRSGSKVGSRRYKALIASTNDAYCPTLRGRLGVNSEVPPEANSVLEIVVNGLDRAAVATALAAGIEAACVPGVVEISAGNYGGKLGKHLFHLRELVGNGQTAGQGQGQGDGMAGRGSGSGRVHGSVSGSVSGGDSEGDSGAGPAPGAAGSETTSSDAAPSGSGDSPGPEATS